MHLLIDDIQTEQIFTKKYKKERFQILVEQLIDNKNTHMSI